MNNDSSVNSVTAVPEKLKKAINWLIKPYHGISDSEQLGKLYLTNLGLLIIMVVINIVLFWRVHIIISSGVYNNDWIVPVILNPVFICLLAISKTKYHYMTYSGFILVGLAVPWMQLPVYLSNPDAESILINPTLAFAITATIGGLIFPTHLAILVISFCCIEQLVFYGLVLDFPLALLVPKTAFLVILGSLVVIGTGLQSIAFRRVAELKEKSEAELLARKAAQARAEFFVDLMGHDLNNINQGVLTGLEILQHGLKKLDIKETSHSLFLVDRILTQVNTGVTLINNVKKFALIDEMNRAGSVVQTDIHPHITRATSAVKVEFRKKIVIKSNIEENKFLVLANKYLMDVFYNLLHNAAKFDTGETVTIEIAAMTKDEAFVEIQVKDNGPGITDKSHIFTRLESSSVRGSGIGLTLVKYIIESYGGAITVADNEPEGTVFTLLLRRSDNQ